MKSANKKYYAPLTESFELCADETKAISMKKYLLNKFEFFGITAPERKILLKQFISDNGLPEKKEFKRVIKELWLLPQREYQLCAIEVLEKNINTCDENHIKLLEHLITNKSWWDTVDFIAAKLVGRFFENYPGLTRTYINKWLGSDNMWLQRTAIIFQLKYKKNTDYKLLFSCIQKCSGSKEFFIRKAIGWALREYAKTDPEKVIAFVENNSLSPLSKKEALRRITF